MKRRGFFGLVAGLLTTTVATKLPALPKPDTEHETFRKTVYWTTYDNRKILIKDLEDGHLVNIILHIHRRMSIMMPPFQTDVELLRKMYTEAQYRRLNVAPPEIVQQLLF